MNEEKNLPMNWYKFICYFQIPFSIIINILELIQLFSLKQYTFITIIIFSITIAWIYFLWIVRRKMINKEPDTYDYILSKLLIGFSLSVINAYFDLTAIIASLIIYFLEYKYFKKRKYIFENYTQKEQLMEQENTLLSKISAIAYIIVVAITYFGIYVLPILIYIYTVYYFATNYGFFESFISFITPVASSLYLFIYLLFTEGLFNILTIPVLLCIISFIIMFSLLKK